MQIHILCKNKIIFVDARTPSDIERLKNKFNAITVFIRNKRVKPINTNHADKDVEKTYETTKEDSNVFAVTYDFSNTIDISVKVVFKFSGDGISVSIPDENITGEIGRAHV